MTDSPMETPSPSSSESLVTQPVSPLWSASGSPTSSDSAYSTGSETNTVPSTTSNSMQLSPSSTSIQLSPLRNQPQEATLSCPIRSQNHGRLAQNGKANALYAMQDQALRGIKRNYPREMHNGMWYETPERLQRLQPLQNAQYRHHHHHHHQQQQRENERYLDGAEHRVPIIHHQPEQWSNILHNDIHMTSAMTNLTRPNQPDPQEYLTAPGQSIYAANHIQANAAPAGGVGTAPQPTPPYQQRGEQPTSTSSTGGASSAPSSETVFEQSTRPSEFDNFGSDRSLFQTSMLNIDEVLFGLS
jgi:hypothetical protein